MTDTVRLDSLDGFGFEKVCRRIFEGAGWGDVELVGGSADRGRDLIIRSPDRTKTIVECKLYTDTVVGRPIVQKLHSAVIDSDADRGIVVTTGRFSMEAVDYAADIAEHGRPILLFDMPKLAELARDAGVRLETGGDHAIHAYPALTADDIAAEMPTILGHIESRPTPASALARITDTHTRLHAMFYARISIHQSFEAGEMTIHGINRGGMRFLFDGSTGEADPTDAARFFGEPGEGAPDGIQCDSRTAFSVDTATLNRSIMEQMVEMHTETVSYEGGNHATYERECAPSPRNIHVDDLRQVYVPRLRVTIEILGYDHECTIECNGDEYRVINPTWRECHECGSHKGLMLCNECGRVACSGGKAPHGVSCRTCGRTVCTWCAWRARRLGLFRAWYCSDCRPEGARQLDG